MARSEVVLGVDVGGTNTMLGFVDRRGNILAESVIPTHAHQPADLFFQRLHEHSDQVYETLADRCVLAGIGLGAPNANYYKGTIEQPPNLSWDFVDVVGIMKQWYRVPVALTNDANAAALGEMLFGAARGMTDFMIITLGTGLGSGIVSNGQLVYGHDGFAGEVGHTTVDPNGRECGCGRRGCLETYASATGLKRTVFELFATSIDASELRGISFRDLTSRRVFEAAERGDVIALKAFDMTGRALGIKLADAVAHTSPEAIILFGGVAKAGALIVNPTKRYMEEHLLNIFKNKVKILLSALPEGKTAVLGAGALIWNEIERRQAGKSSAAA